jgi:hypothetical protein
MLLCANPELVAQALFALDGLLAMAAPINVKRNNHSPKQS